MNKFAKITAVFVLALATAGCAGGILGQVLSASDTAAVQQFLQQAAVSTQTGLDRAYNDFAAATPPQVHGMACVGSYPDPTKPIDVNTNVGTGARSVVAAILREINANGGVGAGAPVGTSAVEALAKLSIYQPGSAQFNWVVTQVETGCIAYAHDINQSINSTAGLFTSQALTAVLAGAPLGM
jgi:hypothetical protein